MGPKTLVHVRFALLVLTAAVLACDQKSPTAPTPAVSPSPPTPAPPTAPAPVPAPVATGLKIEGPESVPPGQTAHYSATASFADGSTRDVTKEVVWRAEPQCCPTPPSPALSISADGVATGLNPGEVFVSASSGTRRSSKQVLVLPPGTFRHHGSVQDAGVGVPDATVTITEGSTAGLSTTTSSWGEYRFYGVSGPIDIAVTKAGYKDQKQELTITRNFQTLTFRLELSAPREDVSGSYTLTVIAAPECASKLPPEARERRYEAVLTQTGPTLTATLQGATFYTSGNERYNRFNGTAEPNRLTFFLGGTGYFYIPDVFDQMTGSTYFSMWGAVVLTGASARRSGTLDGEIEIYNGPYNRIAFCASKAHRFELTR